MRMVLPWYRPSYSQDSRSFQPFEGRVNLSSEDVLKSPVIPVMPEPSCALRREGFRYSYPTEDRLVGYLRSHRTIPEVQTPGRT